MYRNLLWTTIAVLTAASGCASSGPAFEARRASGISRPGPDAVYRVERFRIGWYDGAGNRDTPARLSKVGFDTVMPYSTRSSIEEVLAFLEAAEEEGIGVHMDIPRHFVKDPTGEALEEFVRTLAGSPAILDWYLYDEPEWRWSVRPGMLEKAYSRVKAIDPRRDIALVFILPAFSGAYRGAMDRIWIDYYPVARGSREFFALQDGKYADRMKSFGRRADRYGLPLTIVPQGYGEGDDGKPQFGRRLPTAAETRYMFWASFLSRPEELVYWILYRTQEGWLRDYLLPVVHEFRGKFPDVVEYRSAKGFKIRGGEADAIVLGNGHGGLWLLVLGRRDRECSLEITAPEGYRFREEAGRETAQLRHGIDPFGILFLEISEIH